jgi:predicted nucleic acid-binding protein
MPGRHRISAEQAMLFIDTIRERLALIALDGEEYAGALNAAADVGIVGSAVYDSLLAHCALKAKATTIYTWNIRHYAQCGGDVASRLRTP